MNTEQEPGSLAGEETGGQMSDKDTERVFTEWEQRVSESRHDWLAMRSLLEGRFWKDKRHGLNLPEADFPVKAEVNLLGQWLNSFVANLFKQQARSNPRPDALIDEGQEDIGSDDIRVVQRSVDRFLQRVDIEEQSESVYELALLYGGAAFKRRGLPKGKGASRFAENRVDVSALPPWEAGWDIQGSHTHMNFAFHVQFEPAQDIEERLELKLPEEEFPRCRRLEDTLDDSKRPEASDEGEDLRLLEFYDLTGKGEMRVYVIDSGGRSPRLRCLKRIKLPEADWQKRPLSPLQPVLMATRPGKKLDGISSAMDQYRLNVERNFLLTAIVNAVRRRLSSVIAYLEGKVSEKVLTAIRTGGDLKFVPCEDNEDGKDLAALFHVVEFPEIKADVHRMMGYLDQARQDTAGMSDQTRGKQGEYLTATESRALITYSEQNALPLRAEMDKALGRLCRWYLCFLREAMTKATSYRGLERLELTKELLKVEWFVDVVDTSSTPMERSNRQNNLLVVLPHLENLAAAVDNKETPFLRTYALAMYEHMVRLFDLPPEMQLNRLLPEAKQLEDALVEDAAKAEAEAEAEAMQAQPAQQPMAPDEAALVQMAVAQGAEVV